MTREELIREVKTNFWFNSENKKGINSKKLKAKEYEHIFELLKELTPFLEDNTSIKERFFCIENNITERQICNSPYCNNTVNLKYGGYADFCSADCYTKNKKVPFYERRAWFEEEETGNLTNEEVKEYFLKYYNKGRLDSGKVNGLGLLPESKPYANYLLQHTNFLDSHCEVRERIYCLVNEIEEKMRCKYCNKPLKFHKGGYKDYCNSTCRGNEKREEVESTWYKDNNYQCYPHKLSLEEFLSLSSKDRGHYKMKVLAFYRNKLKKIKNLDTGLSNEHWKDPIKKNLALEKRRSTSLERFGVENVSKSEAIQSKIKATNQDRYGVDNPAKSEVIKEKSKITSLKRYGVAYPTQCEKVRKKTELTNLERYGVTTPFQNDECKEKAKKTNIEKYGATHHLKTEGGREAHRRSVQDKYGVNNVFKDEKVREKIRKTNQSRYGFEVPSKNKDISLKGHLTKKANGSYGTSKEEESIGALLIHFFGKEDIVFQKIDRVRYPFACDFYIKSLDMFVEYNGFWHHGGKAFNPKDQKDLDIVNYWGVKNSSNYNSAIRVWTHSDPEKRSTAKDNNLRWLEIFPSSISDSLTIDNISTQIHRAVEGLSTESNNEVLQGEFKRISTLNKDYSSLPSHCNKIILNYNPHFYEKENEIYKTDPILRRRLIENRIKYLDKPEYDLTDMDLLRGFKISRIHYGFSFHSPFWIKRFTREYNPTKIYDPFGGWGHRLLGSLDNPYIYNDIDERSVEGCKRITHDFGLANKSFYNKDATKFTPKEEYDCVFTCPPYFTDEMYENYNYDGNEISHWIDTFWKPSVDNFIKDSVDLIGVVMSKKYTEYIITPILEKGFDLEFRINVGFKETQDYIYNKKREGKEELLVFKRSI